HSPLTPGSPALLVKLRAEVERVHFGVLAVLLLVRAPFLVDPLLNEVTRRQRDTDTAPNVRVRRLRDREPMRPARLPVLPARPQQNVNLGAREPRLRHRHRHDLTRRIDSYRRRRPAIQLPDCDAEFAGERRFFCRPPVEAFPASVKAFAG